MTSYLFKILTLVLFIFKIKCEEFNSIYGKVVLIEDNIFRANQISLSLEGTNRIAYLNEEFQFVFHNVPIGTYVLRVNDNNFHYEPALVEVFSNEVKAYQYNIKSGKGLKYKYPIDLKPAFKKKYFDDNPNFILSVVKSPYGILIGITLLLFLCMQMMPQDQLKEQFAEMNKQMGQFQNMVKK